LLTALVLFGCASDPDGRALNIGDEPTAKAGASGGTAGHAGHAAGGRDAGDDAGLHVRMEDLQEVTIEIITLQCTGECAEVVAVARGGNAPYGFEWSETASPRPSARSARTRRRPSR
jgi:hypothetical protein